MKINANAKINANFIWLKFNLWLPTNVCFRLMNFVSVSKIHTFGDSRNRTTEWFIPLRSFGLYSSHDSHMTKHFQHWRQFLRHSVTLHRSLQLQEKKSRLSRRAELWILATILMVSQINETASYRLLIKRKNIGPEWGLVLYCSANTAFAANLQIQWFIRQLFLSHHHCQKGRHLWLLSEFYALQMRKLGLYTQKDTVKADKKYNALYSSYTYWLQNKLLNVSLP